MVWKLTWSLYGKKREKRSLKVFFFFFRDSEKCNRIFQALPHGDSHWVSCVFKNTSSDQVDLISVQGHMAHKGIWKMRLQVFLLLDIFVVSLVSIKSCMNAFAFTILAINCILISRNLKFGSLLLKWHFSNLFDDEFLWALHFYTSFGDLEGFDLMSRKDDSGTSCDFHDEYLSSQDQALPYCACYINRVHYHNTFGKFSMKGDNWHVPYFTRHRNVGSFLDTVQARFLKCAPWEFYSVVLFTGL